MAQGGMRVGNTRGITEASPGSRFPTIRVSDRSGTPPQWLPMFLASAQPSSPPSPSPEEYTDEELVKLNRELFSHMPKP